MANSEEDEWEYEYDENETEDFYIPVDLANVPEAQAPIKTPARVGHPTLIKSKLRAINAGRREAENLASGQECADSEAVGEIQLLDLHTKNPLIMYNGQLLSCQWSSTIGTDLIFTKPVEDAGEERKPLRSLPDVDLLALSSAKLIARSARLRPRDELLEEQEPAEVTSASGILQDALTGKEKEKEATDVRPPVSSFLEKLNAVKAKKGEKTRLVQSNGTYGSRIVVAREEVQPSREHDSGEDTIMEGT